MNPLVSATTITCGSGVTESTALINESPICFPVVVVGSAGTVAR